MDYILIENLIIFAEHGVFPEERALGQKFVLSAKLYFDLHPAGISDDLSKTVNYGKICKWITEFTKNHPCRLIETAAEQLAHGILVKYPLIDKISLTLRKPWAPIGLPVDCAGVSVTRARHEAYLSIGSNIGDRRGFLDMAVNALRSDPECIVESVSDYIETKPFGFTEQDDFLNGAVRLRTLYTPEELLERLHSIENAAGRERKLHWGPRTLDMDIILYDDIIMRTPELTIPHIEMSKRFFVLKPLSQIAPYALNPLNGKRVIDMLEELDL